MDEKPLFERLGVTSGKAVLVGVLSLVLIGVVVSQLPSKPVAKLAPRESSGPIIQKMSAATDAHHQTPNQRPILPKSPAQRGTTRPRPLANPAHTLTAWKVTTFENASSHDPFALPSKLVPPKVVKVSPEQLAAERKRLALKRAAEQTAKLEQKRMAELEQKRLAAIEHERKQKRSVALAEKHRIESRILELQTLGVSMFFKAGTERVVKIGELTLRAGEEFEGIYVESIDESGVVVLRPARPIPNLED